MGLFPFFPFAQFPFSPILEQRLIADLEESLVSLGSPAPRCTSF